MTLEQFFKENPKAAIAFSGGVDSSYLLYEALRNQVQVCAYYVKTAFQPEFEYQDALRLAAQLNAPLRVLYLPILENQQITANPCNRCYFCKQQIFTAITQAAEKEGYSLILDGTNASDEESDRPGMRALRELSVRSPLKECGITKQQIRTRSKEAGLFVWDKPAYACLATRVSAGTRITAQILEATERAENFLFSLGFTDFRIRYLDGAARIQLPENQLPLLLQKRETILTQLKKDYTHVLLDLEVRS